MITFTENTPNLKHLFNPIGRAPCQILIWYFQHKTKSKYPLIMKVQTHWQMACWLNKWISSANRLMKVYNLPLQNNKKDKKWTIPFKMMDGRSWCKSNKKTIIKLIQKHKTAFPTLLESKSNFKTLMLMNPETLKQTTTQAVWVLFQW